MTANGDDTFSYDPNGQFEHLGVGETATDSFTYTVTDPDGQSNTATVTITVAGVNDDPVAVDDARTIGEDVAGTFSVLANDPDVDGDALSMDSASASVGSVVVNPNKTVTYTPEANYYGTATVTYTISDGNGGSDTGQLVITINPINDAPVAGADTASTDEDNAVTFSVLGNDTDVENDTLIVTAASALHGTVAVNSDNTLTYTPDADFNGADTVTYDISDGNGGADTGTVAVSVTAVNDAPIAADDTDQTNRGLSMIIDVLANDSDIDLDALTISAIQTGPRSWRRGDQC